MGALNRKIREQHDHRTDATSVASTVPSRLCAETTKLDTFSELQRIVNAAGPTALWARAALARIETGETTFAAEFPRPLGTPHHIRQAKRASAEIIVRLSSTRPPSKAAGDPVTAMHEEIEKYRIRHWSADQLRTAVPKQYQGTRREALFEAFRLVGGKVPQSRKQIGRIIEGGTSSDGHRMSSDVCESDSRN